LSSRDPIDLITCFRQQSRCCGHAPLEHVVLFALSGLYWSIPATLTDRGRAGVLGGMMNFAGNVGGILVPILIGVGN